MKPLSDDAWIGLQDLIEPVRRRLRLVAGLFVGSMLVAAVVSMVWPRPYEATSVLATVGSGRSLGSLSQLAGAAAVIGGIGVGQGDLNPTPELIAALLVSRKVLHAVGSMVSPSRVSLVEALVGEPVPSSEVARRVKAFVRTGINPQTGLVTITARHRDSALARQVGAGVVEQMTRSFIDAARAQARGLRLAQEERLDSAKRQLGRAELSYRDFLRSNRDVGQYSLLSVERSRLARDLDVSNQVYLQATADRQAAVARELQETPAVVVVDPAPEVLPRRPRDLGLKVALAGLVGLVAGVLLAYFLEGGAPHSRGAIG